MCSRRRSDARMTKGGGGGVLGLTSLYMTKMISDKFTKGLLAWAYIP